MTVGTTPVVGLTGATPDVGKKGLTAPVVGLTVRVTGVPAWALKGLMGLTAGDVAGPLRVEV